ncbi:MAG: outer membrane lipoprotein chaperone LolA [Sulfuricellaceae bacterium]|nr:outer membrane lipoprotein chaperone LolA [Sulfuricellaceae bacterium]
MVIKKYLAFSPAYLVFISIAQAGGVEDLKSFLNQTHSLKGQFTQTVLNRNGNQIQSASGQMQFSRPGKFYWAYEKPYVQLIVGDGVKVWMYDPDLNQVTVKKLGQALGSTPAALLAGSGEIEQNFQLSSAGRSNGIDWVEAQPKSKEGGFDSFRIGLKAGQLEAMELRDHFSQTTVIRFSGLERNPKLPASQFVFIPPKGADIVGE